MQGSPLGKVLEVSESCYLFIFSHTSLDVKLIECRALFRERPREVLRINSQIELPLKTVRVRVGAHGVRSPARLNYSLQSGGRGILNDLKKHVSVRLGLRLDR